MRNKNSKNETENLAENLTKSLTDSQLYQKCKKYGGNARLWMRKFEGLLPEVCRRRLYRRRGFTSIHEFAAKLAGMSGYSKVKTVAYIANPKTDKMWAEKVQTESKLQLEIAVKSQKIPKSVPGDTFQSELLSEISAGDEAGISAKPAWTNLNFHISPKVERKFRALKQKLEKESGETMSYGEILKKLMEMAKKGEKISAEKQAVIKVCPDCAEKKAEKAKSKAVPTAIKRLVLARQNNRCNRAYCTHPPSELHHINGYALTKNHSPEGLEYLCEKHHKIAHAQHEFVQIYRRE
jgi:nitrate reductase cytochrome c-type subunit